MHVRPRWLGAFAVLAAIGVGACGGPAATPTTTPDQRPTDPPITITVPAEVAPGATFDASWTGTETSGDFLVIVPAGATTWTETPESPYYNATLGNPAHLVAPKVAGSYEVWFLKGNQGTTIVIKARAPLTVK
jgi:hypothetical protein